MTYREQLSDILWKEKRQSIIERDKLKCLICYNEKYKNKFNLGFIFSNLIPHGSSETVFHNKYHITHIWDFKKNIIETAFINNPKFTLDKSYNVVYKKNENHVHILALKSIENNKIQLNNDILKLIEFGIKAKLAEESLNEIYRAEKNDDKWDVVLGLHVHHKYYQQGLLAWEYPPEALITLCWDCHEILHSTILIPILDIEGNNIGEMTPCLRCHGAGEFPEYTHINSGICFRCDGAKYEELI